MKIVTLRDLADVLEQHDCDPKTVLAELLAVSDAVAAQAEAQLAADASPRDVVMPLRFEYEDLEATRQAFWVIRKRVKETVPAAVALFDWLNVQIPHKYASNDRQPKIVHEPGTLEQLAHSGKVLHTI